MADFSSYDVIAQLDAFQAHAAINAKNQLLDLITRFAAKGTTPFNTIRAGSHQICVS
jgi:hypothetical protein